MSIQLVAEAATCTTHKKHEDINIHVLSGFRTRDPSNRAAADLHLRQHGQRYQQQHNTYNTKIMLIVLNLETNYPNAVTPCDNKNSQTH